jgi:hypothetical protein
MYQTEGNPSAVYVLRSLHALAILAVDDGSALVPGDQTGIFGDDPLHSC